MPPSGTRPPLRFAASLVIAVALCGGTATLDAGDAPRPRLRILNGTSQAMDVFWLRSDADRVPNGSIAPGADTTITTTLGHRFLVVGREDGSEYGVTSVVPVQALCVGGVPEFYARRADAHGFPIVASANVNPLALAEAAYLIDLMLARRPDVREAMIKSGARLSIIAWNEFTTDLPEWRWLAGERVAGFPGIAARDYWDARARGMGGSTTDPFCSCGEENLLGYAGDPYSTENILIHEFAHNIHLRGLVNVDPTFDPRLRAAYDAAMREGLWKGKYAGVNHHEYFAEGVQSWFDNNRENDHDHNHVNTRAELIDYDPRLAALCREVFGDTVLAYTKPASRLTDHLAGYDPATAPTFQWPERLQGARTAIRRHAVDRDAKANAAPAADGGGTPAELWIVTTPAGADLPAGASVRDFPLLVRLSGDTFDFTRAGPAGRDIRFTDAAGAPLVHQVEEWDAARGSASVWVRIPRIDGDTQQAIRLQAGIAARADTPAAARVFDAANGFAAVLHLDDPLADDIGTIRPVDAGTVAVPGLIGPGRRFPAGAGISGGDAVAGLPSGRGPMTTQAWFRATAPNCRLVGWGKERGQGNKIIIDLASPPRITLDCFFANVEGRTPVPLGVWHHVVHTFDGTHSRVYLDGRLDGETKPPLDVATPASFFIGGWYGRYGFAGDMDEVRISSVARSADWIRLEYENQKPLQSLVGPPVSGVGPAAVTPARLELAEGGTADVTVSPGAARMWSWSVVRNGEIRKAAVNGRRFTFAAGRVAGDERLAIRLEAVQPDGLQVVEVPVTVREAIPEPTVSLVAPRTWDGRTPIEVRAVIGNRGPSGVEAPGSRPLHTAWAVSGGAVTRRADGETLSLVRSQYSGPLTIRVAVDDGGAPATAEAAIEVVEPARDAWVARTPAGDERPVDGQFYARDDANVGTLVWNGRLDGPADAVELVVRADGRPHACERARPGADNAFSFSVTLAPGLVAYEAELAVIRGDARTVLETARDLVCGDVLVIQGQSNALATDTREQAPRETHQWIRSHGDPAAGNAGARPAGWCRPVWKREQPGQTEIGWWGMELAKRLVDHHKVPVCVLNGAVGGTRIDQHQRNDADPADPATIYGRLLRRTRAAGLTHGIRAILWHQGENNQGAAGPSGDHDWQTYQELFLDLAADWKEDFPNLRHYYLFQIWPSACAMGRDGNGDMLRERQRTLPRLFSHMDIQATLGVRPPGGCHFPLAGWAEFARLAEPLVARDLHGVRPATAITSPNLVRATVAPGRAGSVALEFDQPVVWRDEIAGQFFIDDAAGRVTGGRADGDVLVLTVADGPAPRRITYLREAAWRQDDLLVGANGLAALTFCDVPIAAGDAAE